MFKQWDELSEVEQLGATLYDLYKDVNGFRPRGVYSEEQLSSKEFLTAELDRLVKQLEVNAQVEQAAEQAAIKKFEDTVAKMIKIGTDRKTAIRWLMEAEGEVAVADHDYFCYLNGLPYGYFKELQ